MFLTLIRHGKSSDMQQGKSQAPESSLSDNSITVLQEMSKVFDSRKYDAVYTSTYTRAQQTAAILFGEHIYKVLDYVHESNMTPHLRGQLYDDIRNYWESLDDAAKYSDDYHHGDGQVQGESFNEFVQRIDNFLHFLKQHHSDEQHIALVGHGHFFRVLIGRLMNPDVFNYKIFSQFWRFFELENGSMVTMELDLDKKKGVIREMKNWEIM